MEAVFVGTFFFLPALVANVAAMLAKPAALVAKPLGRTIDDTFFFGIPIFGSHKTILGCFLMVLAAAAVGENITALHTEWGILPAIFEEKSSWIGGVVLYLLLGVGACAGDLAGSFLKRRFGIPAGKDILILDQVDWFLGALVVLFIAGRFPSWDIIFWAAVVLLPLRIALEIPRRRIFP